MLLAMALANNVLPVPGGPYNRTPFERRQEKVHPSKIILPKKGWANSNDDNTAVKPYIHMLPNKRWEKNNLRRFNPNSEEQLRIHKR